MSQPTQVRASGMYAVFKGETYEAGHGAEDRAIILRWYGHGEPSGGFDQPKFDERRGLDLAIREVDESELDRYYRLTVTCAYNGGGPFRVEQVRHRDDAPPRLFVQYTGDNREWALAQPGMAPPEWQFDQLDQRRVVGQIELAQAEFLREDVEDFKIRRRRRRRGAKT